MKKKPDCIAEITDTFTDKIIEVEKMYGVNELVPLLNQAGFIDIVTAKDLNGYEPAQAGKYFAFWCRRG